MTGINRAAFLFTVFALGGVTGCTSEPAQQAETPANPATEAPRSIFRPGFQAEEGAADAAAGPLDVRIGFSQGSTLDEVARIELERLAQSPQFEAGGPIVLRGHSDAGGSDEANLRASRARAEAVRDWLIEKGAAPDRITVIAFGEQNPIAPNALPDGEPDEKGRARNRRVDIHIDPATDEATPDAETEPTLAETLSNPPTATASAQP